MVAIDGAAIDRKRAHAVYWLTRKFVLVHAPLCDFGGEMSKDLAIMLVALVAACKPPILTEEDQKTISLGLKNIGNGMRQRSCISHGERLGLNQINGVLAKHGSEYRIVIWDLPDRTC